LQGTVGSAVWDCRVPYGGFESHSVRHHPVANGSQSRFCREKTRGICSILRRTSAPWNAGTPNTCPVRSTVKLRPSIRCGARAKNAVATLRPGQ
jgi:hypothetical protein